MTGLLAQSSGMVFAAVGFVVLFLAFMLALIIAKLIVVGSPNEMLVISGFRICTALSKSAASQSSRPH